MCPENFNGLVEKNEERKEKTGKKEERKEKTKE
jgi:hypothetical protein